MEGFEGAVRYCLPRDLPLQEQMGCHTGPSPRGLPGSECRGSGGGGDPETEPPARGSTVSRCPLERVWSHRSPRLTRVHTELTSRAPVSSARINAPVSRVRKAALGAHGFKSSMLVAC